MIEGTNEIGKSKDTMQMMTKVAQLVALVAVQQQLRRKQMTVHKKMFCVPPLRPQKRDILFIVNMFQIWKYFTPTYINVWYFSRFVR